MSGKLRIHLPKIDGRKLLNGAGLTVASVALAGTAACSGGDGGIQPSGDTTRLNLQTTSEVVVDKHAPVECAVAEVVLPTTTVVVKAEDRAGNPVENQE